MDEFDNSVSVPEAEPRPWGLWATAGFSCVIAAAYLAIVVVATIAVLIAHAPGRGFDANEFGRKLQSDGLFLSIIICAAAPVVVGLCVLFAAIRRGISVREYLGLRMVKWSSIAAWSLLTVALAAVSDAMTSRLDRSVTPEFMVSAYTSARFLPLLWVAVTIAAPVYEEIFFRGFLFKGLRHSWLGSAGAVIISALAWAAIHTQYDLYGISHIFVIGLLFGWARAKSGSVVPTIIMHSIVNAIATVQVAVYLSSTSGGS